MTSRDTSDARIPSVPIEMPSDTAMVLNSTGVPPASRMPCFTFSARRPQVHVAGRDLGPGVGDADERLLEVGVGVAGPLEHGARRGAGGSFLQRVASHRSVIAGKQARRVKKNPRSLPGAGAEVRRQCLSSAARTRAE